MDPASNPYTPNAGALPPELAGRTAELEAFEVLLERLNAGLTPQSLMLVGHRGMGKTALMEALLRVAHERTWVTVEAEITPSDDFGQRMAQIVRQALLNMSPASKWRERSKAAASVLRSFNLKLEPDGSLTAGLGVEPAAGMGDSGNLETDLSDLLVALGDAAAEHGTGIVLFLDELQGLQAPALRSLLMALHKVVQKQLPLTVVGAGLPVLRRRLAEARSYAERLFTFPAISLLDRDEAELALVRPANANGLLFSEAARAAALDFAQGYPYFLQEVGSAIWDITAGPEVSHDDAVRAIARTVHKLDSGFYRLRLERATPNERGFAQAMSACVEPAAVADVAVTLSRTEQQVRPALAGLVSKGLVEVGADGMLRFTVPGFSEFLGRVRDPS